MNIISKTTLVLALSVLPVGAFASTATEFGFEAYSDDKQFADGELLRDSAGTLSDFVSIRTQGDNTMSVERIGSGPNDTVNGFVYDTAGTTPKTYDVESPNEKIRSLGQYFLRTTESISAKLLETNVFSFDFAGGAAGVAGTLWDIDGNAGQGTEQWRLDANLRGGGTQSLTSPLGTTTDDDGGDGLDGRAWVFDFEAGANEILSLDFVFVGTKTAGIGAAFDSLVVTQDVAPVPLPASILLLGAAMGGLGAMRRFGRA